MVLFVQARMEEAKSLFRNAETTQFIIVTIPTVMAAAESTRLADALRKEGVPVQLMVINQVCQTSSLCMAYSRQEMMAAVCLLCNHMLSMQGRLADPGHCIC